jgi:hypothetical protein
LAVCSPAEAERFKRFEEFWPYYLRAHAKPLTRGTHYAAAASTALGVVAAVVTANLWCLVAGIASSFVLTLSGHTLIERNRQTLFVYPWWSISGCLRLSISALTGHLSEDMEKAGIVPDR